MCVGPVGATRLIALVCTPVVESRMGMEVFLNLVWVCVAALMFSLWLRFASRSGSNRRVDSRRIQFVALAVLVLLLFPVISVTDDLQAAQNPAEAASCHRRDHVYSTTHGIFPAVGALPLPAFAGLTLGIPHPTKQYGLRTPVVANRALAPIQSRPPPTV